MRKSGKFGMTSMNNQEHNKRLSRRDFIKITAVAGSVLVGGKLLTDLTRGELVTVQESRTLMGTVINLTVVTDNNIAGKAAVEATFAELERQVSIFNHRISDSPLAVLNRTGRVSNPPQDLVEVLHQAMAISEMSEGAFDVTVKPILDLYLNAQPDLPSTEQVVSTLNLVDFSQLSVSNKEIVFRKPSMEITLDGIAKGYIVDRGTAVLKGLGFENVYVEAGGDLIASGLKDGDLPWKIGIQSPRESKPGLLNQINVSDQAVATSGDYFQHFSEDLRHHHIIDPRIGYSAPELASVTIISDNVMLSDALATSVMVMGVDNGLQLIESLEAVEAFMVTKDLEVVATSGFGNGIG
jgi:thiamine biosynthesis lipoprotein